MKQPRLRAWRLARAARRDERQPAPPAESALPAIAEKADDLQEIKKSVEDAAAVSGGLWLSYLFVLSYIAIAAGAVTHEDLLLERAVKLPFLNVELPLLAFFALAPFVILITHAYALLHFIMLGKKASRFHTELRRQFPDSEIDTQKSGVAPDGTRKDIRDKLRRLLPSNIFVQILAGPPELRTGIFGLMLKLIALTTLVVYPILVLLLLQIQFLPFHAVNVTWAQRVALILDIVFLWLLRPPVLSDWRIESLGWARARGRSLRKFGLFLGVITSITAFWFSIVIATIPGEWQETGLVSLNPPVLPVDANAEGEEKAKAIRVRDLLFAGEVDDTTRRRTSLFSNTLVLPGFNLYEALKIDDPAKLAWREHLADLRGRHLEHAVLNDADLTRADLTGAELQVASLNSARLQGVSLDGAEMQGASLDSAQLRGASLDSAQLQGASLSEAQLQGAWLENAQLQGAQLLLAQLQGATLDEAQLRGAALDYTQLMGASLVDAQLQGALFSFAQLQGASLNESNLTAADLTRVFLWRADFDSAKLNSLLTEDLRWTAEAKEETFLNMRVTSPRTKPWKEKDYLGLKQNIGSNVTLENLRTRAFSNIAILDCDKLQRMEKFDFDKKDYSLASCGPKVPPPNLVQQWQRMITQASVGGTLYVKALRASLAELACNGDDDALYVVRGLGINGRIEATGSEAPALVDFIMSKKCPVSTSLTDDDKVKMLKIKQDAEKQYLYGPALADMP